MESTGLGCEVGSGLLSCCVGMPDLFGESTVPFSKAKVTAGELPPFEMPLVSMRRVLGLGVNELGLMNNALVADPTKRLGDKIGEPV